MGEVYPEERSLPGNVVSPKAGMLWMVAWRNIFVISEEPGLPWLPLSFRVFWCLAYGPIKSVCISS